MNKLNRLFISCVVGFIVFLPSLVMAEGKTLSAIEIKTLFSGKTFDGLNVAKDKRYTAFSKASGMMVHRNAKRTKEVAWTITDDGKHCVKFKNNYCGTIVSMGGGVYHKMRDGSHINTLTNFRDGNDM